MLLGDGSVEEKTLQAAIDEWVSRVSTIECNCVCKSSTSGELLAGPEGANTKHRETLEISQTPDILHVKVKERGMLGTIKMADTFI